MYNVVLLYIYLHVYVIWYKIKMETGKKKKKKVFKKKKKKKKTKKKTCVIIFIHSSVFSQLQIQTFRIY